MKLQELMLNGRTNRSIILHPHWSKTWMYETLVVLMRKSYVRDDVQSRTLSDRHELNERNG